MARFYSATVDWFYSALDRRVLEGNSRALLHARHDNALVR
jgi:hypothetical protein